MHILFLADDYPSPGRPSFVFVQQLVHALLEQGVEVSVVASQSLTHAIRHRQKLLPRKHRVDMGNGLSYSVYRPYGFSFGNSGKHITALFKWFNQKNVDAVIKKIKPDVLYGHFWHSADKLKNYAIIQKKALFVACGEGDNALEDLVASMAPDTMQSLRKAVSGVISVSSENKRKCVSYDLAQEKDIVVLPNCVDDTLFHPVEGGALRERLGVKNDDFLVLFVGGFVPRKGADRLSAAIRKLNDKHIKSAFVGKAMGTNEALPDCEGMVWKGTVEHEKLPEFYAAADIFVLPTLNEGCSNAIVEALACGVPVISSDRPFNDDILNESNSILIDPESVDEIASAIQKMKSNKQFYQQKKNYTMAHSGDFSIRKRAQSIYRFICDKSK